MTGHATRLLDPWTGEDRSSPGRRDEDGRPIHFLSPPLFDLVAFPQEPGNEHREALVDLARAARLGGVGRVGLMPCVDPVADHDGVIRTLLHGARTAETGVTFLPHGAATLGLGDTDIAPMGELKAAGVLMVTDGGRPLRDTRLLRRVLEYARNFDIPVLLRPVDPWLNAGALAPEGPEATRYGLPSVPAAAERLAVLRLGELARLTGARVVLFPLVTEAGLDALASIRAQGVPLSGGTALPYLLWSVLDTRTYDGLYRLDPPLPRAADTLALCDAVHSGLLDFLATGHRAVNLSEKQTEFAIAEPGMAVLAHTWTLLPHLSQLRNLPLIDLVRALTVGPATVLGLDPDRRAPLPIVRREPGDTPAHGAGLARNFPALPPEVPCYAAAAGLERAGAA